MPALRRYEPSAELPRVAKAGRGPPYNGRMSAAAPHTPSLIQSLADWTFGPAPRRSTRQVDIGGVKVGGDAPVVVQSMTNTDTADVASTAKQIAELWRAGSEMVRITVNTPEAAAAVPRIVERLAMQGIDVPVIGDFHYNGHQLLEREPACAQALAKYRINPGNVGRGTRRDPQFTEMVETACRHDKPVRIGVNWGSLDPELIVRMMDDNAKQAIPEEAAVITRRALVASAIDSAALADELAMPWPGM